MCGCLYRVSRYSLQRCETWKKSCCHLLKSLTPNILAIIWGMTQVHGGTRSRYWVYIVFAPPEEVFPVGLWSLLGMVHQCKYLEISMGQKGVCRQTGNLGMFSPFIFSRSRLRLLLGFPGPSIDYSFRKLLYSPWMPRQKATNLGASRWSSDFCVSGGLNDFHAFPHFTPHHSKVMSGLVGSVQKCLYECCTHHICSWGNAGSPHYLSLPYRLCITETYYCAIATQGSSPCDITRAPSILGLRFS